MTNPFAPAGPQAQPAQQPQAQPGNPFAAGPPAAPAQPASPPYGATAGGAPAPSWLAQPAAPAPVQQAAPPAIDPNSFRSVGAPPPSSGGKGPKLAHMYNRLVMVFPLSRTMRPKKAEYITAEQHASGQTMQDTITATVVVLDAGPGQQGPISFGGNPAAFPPVPDTDSAPLPYIRKAMWITQSQIVAQIESALPAGPGATPGVVIGRVMKAGPERNDPWYLLGATPEDEQLARTYLGLVGNGAYPHPLA